MKKNIWEIRRKLRAFKYWHAPARIKRARTQAFQKEWANPILWTVEPKRYISDQPD